MWDKSKGKPLRAVTSILMGGGGVQNRDQIKTVGLVVVNQQMGSK